MSLVIAGALIVLMLCATPSAIRNSNHAYRTKHLPRPGERHWSDPRHVTNIRRKEPIE